MSTTTFAMPVSLDGPLPVAPEHSLLTVPGVLVDDPDLHWMSGATIYGYPVETPLTWDPCSTGTFRTKSSASTQPLPQFAAFVAYVAITCSSFSLAHDPAGFRDRAEAVLDATESFAVEQALSMGVDQSISPFFLDGNETLPNGVAAVAPEVALGFLEDAIGSTGRQGLIHMTPGTIAGLGFNFLREEENEGPLSSNVGTPVVAGGGYIGAHQIGHTVATGEAWAFATGPVRVRHTPMEVLEIADAMDWTQNDVTFRAERYVLAEWDTALQAAILVDWTP